VKTLLPFQWGEPLLHPRLSECIAYAVRRRVRVMLTTNGILLDEKNAKKLISAGLDRLTLSFDGNKETHGKLRGVDPERIISNAKRFREIRDRWGVSCALDVSMVVDELTEPHMQEFQRLFTGIADRIQYIPRLVQKRRIAPCRELWRGVLVVLSNGDVTLCCADAEGKASLGNVRDHSPASFFNSRGMKQIRRLHGQGKFASYCQGCGEYASARVSPRFS